MTTFFKRNRNGRVSPYTPSPAPTAAEPAPPEPAPHGRTESSSSSNSSMWWKKMKPHALAAGVAAGVGLVTCFFIPGLGAVIIVGSFIYFGVLAVIKYNELTSLPDE